MTGMIMDIKRFAVHDGEGIRTTIFLKGCPLRCVWCHNPEGISFEPQIAFIEKKCVNCLACVKACKQHAQTVTEDGKHKRIPSLCSHCGECVEICPQEALKLYGKPYTVSELVDIVMEDKMFYDNSNGGVTLSGGECLMQYTFCKELLKALKEKEIHTAVDTCGAVLRQAFLETAPYTDVYLYDIKAIDDDVHRSCTGHGNRMILENLMLLNDLGKQIEVRFPYVPGYNDSQTEKIAQFLSGLRNVHKVRVLPYHNFAGSKYLSLSMANTLPDCELPKEEEIEKQNLIFEHYGLPVAR